MSNIKARLTNDHILYLMIQIGILWTISKNLNKRSNHMQLNFFPPMHTCNYKMLNDNKYLINKSIAYSISMSLAHHIPFIHCSFLLAHPRQIKEHEIDPISFQCTHCIYHNNTQKIQNINTSVSHNFTSTIQHITLTLFQALDRTLYSYNVYTWS